MIFDDDGIFDDETIDDATLLEILNEPPPVEIIVSDWTDPVLLPREARDLRFRAEISAAGRCPCGGYLTVLPEGYAFTHKRLCRAADFRSSHITERVHKKYGRVIRSRSFFCDNPVWRSIVAGQSGTVIVRDLEMEVVPR